MLRSLFLMISLSVLLFMSGCSGGGGTGDSGGGGGTGDNGNASTTAKVSLTPPPVLLSDPAEIAAALSKQETLNLGVWSLLEQLGIGVYTPEGDVVMQGAENTVDDFWLYDRQIPTLAAAALSKPTEFSKFHRMVTSHVSTDITSAELLAAYQEFYSNNPNYFLAKLFTSMGLNFTGDPKITRLQEVLLFLGGFAAPPQIPAPVSTPSSPVAGVKIAKSFQQDSYNICMAGHVAANKLSDGLIEGGKEAIIAANIKAVNAVREFLSKKFGERAAGILSLGKSAYDFVDAMFIDLDIQRTISVDKDKTHVSSCTNYPSPVVTAIAGIDISTGNDVGESVAKCGRLAGMKLKGYGGRQAVPSVGVDWIVTGEGAALLDYTIDSSAQTDMYGQSKLVFTPKTTNQCDGQKKQLPVTVEAEFHTAPIIASMGDVPQVLAGILTQVINNSSFENTDTFNVEYHDRIGPANLSLEDNGTSGYYEQPLTFEGMYVGGVDYIWSNVGPDYLELRFRLDQSFTSVAGRNIDIDIKGTPAVGTYELNGDTVKVSYHDLNVPYSTPGYSFYGPSGSGCNLGQCERYDTDGHVTISEITETNGDAVVKGSFLFKLVDRDIDATNPFRYIQGTFVAP